MRNYTLSVLLCIHRTLCLMWVDVGMTVDDLAVAFACHWQSQTNIFNQGPPDARYVHVHNPQ